MRLYLGEFCKGFTVSESMVWKRFVDLEDTATSFLKCLVTWSWMARNICLRLPSSLSECWGGQDHVLSETTLPYENRQEYMA